MLTYIMKEYEMLPAKPQTQRPTYKHTPTLNK